MSRMSDLDLAINEIEDHLNEKYEGYTIELDYDVNTQQMDCTIDNSVDEVWGRFYIDASILDLLSVGGAEDVKRRIADTIDIFINKRKDKKQ